MYLFQLVKLERVSGSGENESGGRMCDNLPYFQYCCTLLQGKCSLSSGVLQMSILSSGGLLLGFQHSHLENDRLFRSFTSKQAVHICLLPGLFIL